MKQITLSDPLVLESGVSLENVKVGYHTFGSLNEDKSNVVWVFHALTGNSNPLEWWPEIVGKGKILDTDRYFVVCANMLGSCYGSTEPEDFEFPLITIRDQVKCFQQLLVHLEIKRVHIGIGGSMGGQQLLEWAVMKPKLFSHIIPIATNAVHSAWGIAFNETQRMAIQNDPNEGLATARAIAMLSYRHYQTFENTQTDKDFRSDTFSASSYQEYQGKKLKDRFSTYSYHYLSKAMDSQNVGRQVKNTETALSCIEAKTLVIGIDSDILFPTSEQQYLATHIPNATFAEIESTYGHDGFLVEHRQLSQLIKDFLEP
ncbi:MAG: homoserine O-acetyltransferase [Bacteroidota bacterium]